MSVILVCGVEGSMDLDRHNLKHRSRTQEVKAMNPLYAEVDGALHSANVSSKFTQKMTDELADNFKAGIPKKKIFDLTESAIVAQYEKAHGAIKDEFKEVMNLVTTNCVAGATQIMNDFQIQVGQITQMLATGKQDKDAYLQAMQQMSASGATLMAKLAGAVDATVNTQLATVVAEKAEEAEEETKTTAKKSVRMMRSEKHV